jgi:phospholipid/cholesterol/gamma-HCH transport system substrate-binding protein
MEREKTEIVVGIAIIILSLLLVLGVYNKGFLEKKGDYYKLKASFERADGINIGNDVLISGVKIGEVLTKELDKNNYNALITLSVNKDIKLPLDTSAEIASANLMGDKYISLVPGAETELLKDGDSIEFTQSSINLEGLLTKFFFGLDSKNENTNSEAQ